MLNNRKLIVFELSCRCIEDSCVSTAKLSKMYRICGFLLGVAVVALGAPASDYHSDIRSATCGIVQIGNTKASSAQRFLDKIVGGSEATPSSWPWQVGLRLQSTGMFFCGGSIIDNKWIVTAGHCCDTARAHGISDGAVEVLAGIHNMENVQPNDVFTVKQMIIHQRYSANPLQYDICLLELDRELTYGIKVQPVCVATTQWPAGTECWTSGWGSTNFNTGVFVLPEILQDTSVSLTTQAACQAAYAPPSDLLIAAFTVCAVKPGAGPCRGDSGGPLVCRRGNQWELVGVTSAVSATWGCGHPYFPTVFANIPYFADWILSYTGIPV